MTNIPSPDFRPKEYERRADFERSVDDLPQISRSTVWIILAAVVVILVMGIYAVSRSPTPVSTKDMTEAAPGAVSAPALPKAPAATFVPTPAASPAP